MGNGSRKLEAKRRELVTLGKQIQREIERLEFRRYALLKSGGPDDYGTGPMARAIEHLREMLLETMPPSRFEWKNGKPIKDLWLLPTKNSQGEIL